MADVVELLIEDLDQLRAALQGAPGVVHRHFKAAMHRAVNTVQARAQVYPDPPPNSKYKRTGTLGRRWETKVEAQVGAITGRVQNLTPYGPYVMGDDDQAWMHVGRWKTETGIFEDVNQEVQAHFDEGLDAVVKEISQKAQ